MLRRVKYLRGTIVVRFNYLIINYLYPWNNFELKKRPQNRVTSQWRTPHTRNHLTAWRYKASAKGCRGYGEPERQTVGCDPEKFFLQIFQKHNTHKINALAKFSSEQ